MTFFVLSGVTSLSDWERDFQTESDYPEKSMLLISEKSIFFLFSPDNYADGKISPGYHFRADFYFSYDRPRIVNLIAIRFSLTMKGEVSSIAGLYFSLHGSPSRPFRAPFERRRDSPFALD